MSLTKITVLAMAAVFAVISCVPQVEETPYDWTAANAFKDLTRNSSISAITDFVPDFEITEEKAGAGAASGDIVSVTIEIEFPAGNNIVADVLKRSVITEADIGFLTFHTFTKGENDKGEADKLSNAIPFTIERRQGAMVRVELDTKDIFTADIKEDAGYSDIIVKINGSNYTFNGGLRLDVDNSGTFEAEYDNYYMPVVANTTGDGNTVGITGSASGLKAGDFVGPGNKGWSVTLLPPPGIVSVFRTENEYQSASKDSNFFYFWDGQEKSTMSERFLSAKISFENSFGAPSNSQTDEAKSAYKDVGEKIASGIKLQKLSGGSWTDVATAEYTANEAVQTVDTADYYIFFRRITYDHLGTYRIAWNGSADQRTSGEYFGVRQKIEITAAGRPSVARPFNVTEVTGETNTIFNTNLVRFEAVLPIPELYSFNYDQRDIVLKFTAPNDGGTQYFWKELSLQDFRNSFKIAACKGEEEGDDCLTLKDANIVFINIDKVEFLREGLENSVYPARKNVMMVYLDPNYRISPLVDPEGPNNTKRLYSKRAYINSGFGYDSSVAPPTGYQGNYVYGSTASPAYAYDFFDFYRLSPNDDLF